MNPLIVTIPKTGDMIHAAAIISVSCRPSSRPGVVVSYGSASSPQHCVVDAKTPEEAIRIRDEIGKLWRHGLAAEASS